MRNFTEGFVRTAFVVAGLAATGAGAGAGAGAGCCTSNTHSAVQHKRKNTDLLVAQSELTHLSLNLTRELPTFALCAAHLRAQHVDSSKRTHQRALS